jgi:uncharacterized protein YxjI
LSGSRLTAVKDARGQKLFTIQHKLLSIHSTYQGIDPTSGSVLFTVKSSLSFGTKLTATFKNLAGDGRDHELVLRGDLLDRSAEITTEGGVPVARISRSFANAGEIFCTSNLHLLYPFIPLLPVIISRVLPFVWTVQGKTDPNSSI